MKKSLEITTKFDCDEFICRTRDIIKVNGETKNIIDLTEKEIEKIRKHYEHVLNNNQQEKVYVLVTIETSSDPEGKEVQEIKGVYKDKTLAVHEKKSLKKHKYYDLIFIEEHFIY